MFKEIFYTKNKENSNLYDIIAVHCDSHYECTLFLGSKENWINSFDGTFLGYPLSRKDFDKMLKSMKIIEKCDVCGFDPEKTTQFHCYQIDNLIDLIEIDNQKDTFYALRGVSERRAAGYNEYGAPIYSHRLSRSLFEIMLSGLKNSELEEIEGE